MKTASEAISFARDKHGDTQYALAVAIGVTPASISNWESGKNEPTLFNLARIAKHYDMTLDDFVEFEK